MPNLHAPLGQSDLHSPLMLGGNVFGWTIDEKTSFGILDAFVDAGFNAIDTSDSYARWVPGHQGGESETIIGNWLQERAASAARCSSPPRSARTWAKAAA